MKLIAKANISGPFGRADKGVEFTADAATGADLIGRGLAEEAPKAAKPKKPDKAPAEAG